LTAVGHLAGFATIEEFGKKSMGLAKEVAPSQVFDFSFAAKALGHSKN
jgi:hypothetical protein